MNRLLIASILVFSGHVALAQVTADSQLEAGSIEANECTEGGCYDKSKRHPPWTIDGESEAKRNRDLAVVNCVLDNKCTDVPAIGSAPETAN
jgi:hypothetical protein